MKTKLLILISFIVGVNGMLNANEFAKIYFTNWNYLRRSAYTETDVRNKPDILIQINDSAEINRLKHCCPVKSG
jgi:hypothetical protein